MLSRAEFEDEYPPERLEAELPEEPISSLRDIQYLYGRLYTLGTTGGGEYAPYLTPDQASDIVDDEESLIVVKVDLSGDTPQLDPEQPVRVTRYTEDLIQKVGHCKYSAARGIDHSVTHQAGRNSDPEKLARYAKERLTKWATDDVVTSSTEDHEDGWIIRDLAEVGKQEDALDRIESALKSALGGSTTALLTVQVKCKSDEEYRWPGELDVFNAAMRARKLSKLVSKGQATDSAGTATDLLTGAQTRTVGTADDPLNYYLGKQMETFPGLDPDEAWRTHPISEDGAVSIGKAETFIEACTYSTFGATVYYLPYFLGQLEPDNAYLLYDILISAVVQDDMTPVEQMYDRIGDDGIREHGPTLRFYVAAVMKHQMSRYDVFSDTLHGSLVHPVKLRDKHTELLRGWAFDVENRFDDPISAPLPTHEEWPLLRYDGLLESIATGSYFYATFSLDDDDQDASADDARIEALIAALSGESIAIETLLSEYVDRLIDETGESFPDYIVASQFAQLCALSTAGYLTASDMDAYGTAIEPPDYATSQQMDAHDTRARADGGSKAAVRAEKLDRFVEETPAFDPDDERGAERRGVFLLGVLVGQVGGYQQGAEGRSTTVVDQYSIKSMSKSKVKRITQEVLDRNVVYSRENGLGSTMYSEVVDRLVETFSERDPETWGIGTDDLRFYYSLGISYGLNSWVDQEALSEEDTTNESN